MQWRKSSIGVLGMLATLLPAGYAEQTWGQIAGPSAATMRGSVVADQNVAPPLPKADSAIQGWMRDLANPADRDRFFAATRQFTEAASDAKLTPQQWYTQMLIFLLKTERGDEALGTELTLMEYASSLDGSPSDLVSVVAPYLNSDDHRAAIIAGSMIEHSGAFDLSESHSLGLAEPPIFVAMERYLRSLGGADPSWGILERMYVHDPDAAMNTMLHAHFDRDRDSRAKIERMRKELLLLILTHDLAGPKAKPDLARNIAAKLDEMAAHAQWCVRAYALAITYQASLSDRYPWAMQTDFGKLEKDPHPVVAFLAQLIPGQPLGAP